jgi:hypothetical protein
MRGCKRSLLKREAVPSAPAGPAKIYPIEKVGAVNAVYIYSKFKLW